MFSIKINTFSLYLKNKKEKVVNCCYLRNENARKKITKKVFPTNKTRWEHAQTPEPIPKKKTYANFII